MDLELLNRAQEYIYKMANGINPVTGEFATNNDMVNNIKISRCLFYVNNILKEVISDNKVSKNKLLPFTITPEDLTKYEYIDEKLSISRIVSKINNLNTNSLVTNLKTSQVCNWLISMDILKIVESDNHKYKRPTEKGLKIGLSVNHVSLQFKEYDIVLYDINAQRYIIANFNSLLEYINK